MADLFGYGAAMDTYKRAKGGSFDIKEGVDDWVGGASGETAYWRRRGPNKRELTARGRLYAETAKQRAGQEEAMGLLGQQLTAGGPALATQQADISQDLASRNLSARTAAAGSPQAHRAALFGGAATGSALVAPEAAGAAKQGSQAMGAYLGGAGQVIGGRAQAEAMAQRYAQMAQQQKYRQQALAEALEEQKFADERAKLGQFEAEQARSVNYAMGGLQAGAGLLGAVGG